MGNVSSKMETSREHQKEMLEIKNKDPASRVMRPKNKQKNQTPKTTITEMKNVFRGLKSRLDTAEERTSVGASLPCC